MYRLVTAVYKQCGAWAESGDGLAQAGAGTEAGPVTSRAWTLSTDSSPVDGSATCTHSVIIEHLQLPGEKA